MINASLDRCLSFINSQSAPAKRAVTPVGLRRAVTISRQAGCGAVHIAEKLAAHLQQHAPPQNAPWTIFDRNLMDQVLADHNLPAYLAKTLPEDRMSALEDMIAEIVGARPTVQKLVLQTSETVLKFADLGGVIIIGRGGNIITAKLPQVLHVRLVAPLDDRIERICRDDNKSPADARKFCVEEEQSRARYLKTYFNADINDPMGYHLVINTSRVGFENTAKLIGDAVLRL
jgi:cytidylate kinase